MIQAILLKITHLSQNKEITNVTNVRKSLKVPKVFQIIKLFMMARQRVKFVVKLSLQGAIYQGIWKCLILSTLLTFKCIFVKQHYCSLSIWINKHLILDFYGFLQDMGSSWNADVYASLTCPVCGKKFSNRTSLADHKAVHEGRTFCTVCNKLCSTLANLRRHQKTHSNFDSNWKYVTQYKVLYPFCVCIIRLDPSILEDETLCLYLIDISRTERL